MSRITKLLPKLAIALIAATIVAGSISAYAQDAKKLRFVFVTSAGPGNPFYGPIIKGFEQAGKDLDVEVVFRGDQQTNLISDAPTMLNRLENAISTKPDGLIISDTYPESLNPTIKAAVDSGIPVVLTNAGFGEASKVGAMAFVGTDETDLGRMGGKLLKDLGAKHVLVVTTPPGIPLIDDRVAGLKDGMSPGKTTALEVPIEVLGDQTKQVNTTLAALEKDATIDAVFSIGSCCGPAMVAAREELGARADKMHWVTIDLGAPVLQALKDKKIDYAIDQQQYLEGYIPVQMLAMAIRYSIKPVNDFYPTGPGLVNAENAAKVIELTAQAVR
jgi:simple sugar transport system substrate-binding protein